MPTNDGDRDRITAAAAFIAGSEAGPTPLRRCRIGAAADRMRRCGVPRAGFGEMMRQRRSTLDRTLSADAAALSRRPPPA